MTHRIATMRDLEALADATAKLFADERREQRRRIEALESEIAQLKLLLAAPPSGNDLDMKALLS